MSKTPRTDKAASRDYAPLSVPYDFARELERELTEVKAMNQQAAVAFSESILMERSLSQQLTSSLARERQLREALESIERRRPVMGSVGDFREGQLDTLSAVAEQARIDLSLPPPPVIAMEDAQALVDALEIVSARDMWIEHNDNLIEWRGAEHFLDLADAAIQAFQNEIPKTNTMKQSEQLKIALAIVEADESGNPIEWEIKLSGDWRSRLSQYGPLDIIKADGEIRLKPWTLGRTVNGHTLPDNKEWMLDGWTKNDLPEKTRPLMLGEVEQDGDYWQAGSGTWLSVRNIEPNASFYKYKRRTTRPIPVVEKWAAQKAALAEGKKVKYRFLMDAKEWSRWKHINHHPAWIEDGSHEYMVEPEPILLDLGPEDIEPNSVFRVESWPEGCHRAYLQVQPIGISFGYLSTEITPWAMLRKDGWLIQRPSKPGVWERCEKEAE